MVLDVVHKIIHSCSLARIDINEMGLSMGQWNVSLPVQ